MYDCPEQSRDKGAEPYVLNVNQAAVLNRHFRTAVWTGKYMQMTLMSIPPGGEIGWEKHTDTDQVIRIEQGRAAVQFGMCRAQITQEEIVSVNDTIFVPAGTWHNVVNLGRYPLKVSSIYAPPHHPKGTVHRTREDAEYSKD